MPANLKSVFKSRDFGRLIEFTSLQFDRPVYSNHVLGGPREFSQTVRGNSEALRQLMQLARCAVDVYDGMDEWRWGGMIWELTIYDGPETYGFTLDGMANKIAVFYTQQTINQRYSSSGDTADTGFSSDATSAAEYGTMELRVTADNLESAAATARQAQELAARKDPQGTYGIEPENSQEPYAVIRAKGWFESLDFRFYTNLEGNAAGIEQNAELDDEAEQILGGAVTIAAGVTFVSNNTITGPGTLPMGASNPYTQFFVTNTASNNNYWTVTANISPGSEVRVTPTDVDNEGPTDATFNALGQLIWQTWALEVDSPFYAAAIDIRIRKDAAATDNVLVKLYSVSGSLPDTLLATGTILNAEIGSQMGWVTVVLDTAVLISFGTTYGIRIERSGAASQSAFYVGVDEGLNYARGSLQLYTNATHGWKARGTNADLIFRISGLVETTTQIVSIEASVGEFLSSVVIENASGIFTPPYRDGLNTAKEYVLELLAAGTSNQRRMLARVDRDRRLIVYEEPVAGSVLDFVLKNGKIFSRDESPIPPHHCPYGQWAIIKKLELTPIDNTKFIEAVDYDGQRDTYSQIVLKNQRGDLEIVSF